MVVKPYVMVVWTETSLLFGSADHSKGFGGKFGVQKDRVDKSAVGWDHHESLQKHESQIGNLVENTCTGMLRRPHRHACTYAFAHPHM